MKFSVALAVALLMTFSFSCKKDKGDSDDGETKITTIEVSYVNATTGVYGLKYTFKLKFEALGDVSEYGILYKAWIGDTDKKIPTIEDPETSKLPFGASPSALGTIESRDLTLRYADFNDANYRAYAVTESGQVVYGEVLYITFA